MAQSELTQTDSTAEEQENTEQESNQAPPTTREGFKAYMDQKRGQQGQPEPEEEGEAEPEGRDDPEPEPEEEVPAHKRQLEPSDKEFQQAEKPPEVDTQDKSGEDKPWFAELPEDARQRIQQAEQYANSLYQNYQALQGRLAPVQRQNEDLRKQVEDLNKQLQERSQENPSIEDLDNSDAWKEVLEEFPDESAEVKKLFTGKESALQEANQKVQQLEQELARIGNDRKQAEWNRLKARHPDADAVRAHPQFHQWLQQKSQDSQADPELVRKMQSPFYEDVADVIDAFKTDFFGQQPHQPAGQARTQPEAPATGSPPQSRRPPPPSPPSQGSGVTGAQRPQGRVSDREAFRQEIKRRRKQAR